MKRNRKPGKPPLYAWGPVPSFFLAVALAGLSTLLCLWMQPNSLRSVLSVFRAQPLLIILNCLPIGLLILAFTFLFRNVFSSACLVGTLCALLSLASRIKLEVRDEPVFPRDLLLLKEAGSAVGTYRITWPWALLVAILFFALAMGFCAQIVGCKPFPVASLRGIGWRIGGFFASVATLVVLILTVYASNDLYNSFRVSNAYYIPSVFNELGFPYCFCHNFTTYAVDRPEGFSKAQAELWEQETASGAQAKDVNVIMVMNEAFSDLTDEEAFTYSGENDPLPNLHALQNDPHCIAGHVVVPGFAGGTANTEFDVLTGMQTNALSATTTSAFRAVNRNLDSLFRVFGADGYATQFLHPGDAWFYNRENVYRWFGAEEIVFAEDMDHLTYKGRWVTDASMADLIEKNFETAAAADQPLFNYTVTIQNHMSYTADKYGAGYDFPAVETSVPLSDEARTMLEVYIEGVRDADAMLGKLQSYFSGRDEPVVLVFWGDHLPYLGDNQLCYKELGSEVSLAGEERENAFCAYETPYVIWANDAAAAALDWDTTRTSLELPADERISACYLGQTVLELTGRGGENAWFSYLGEVRRQLPVLQKTICETADGSVVDQVDLAEEQRQLIAKLRQWSYYKMKYKDVK